MVEYEAVVVESMAEARVVSLGQDMRVTVSVTGSHADKALRYRVSRCVPRRMNATIFQGRCAGCGQLKIMMLQTHFWDWLVARERPTRLNATREVARCILSDGRRNE